MSPRTMQNTLYLQALGKCCPNTRKGNRKHGMTSKADLASVVPIMAADAVEANTEPAHQSRFLGAKPLDLGV